MIIDAKEPQCPQCGEMTLERGGVDVGVGPVNVYVKPHGTKVKVQFCFTASRVTSIITHDALAELKADASYNVMPARR